jgi:uncharacterized membrane protein
MRPWFVAAVFAAAFIAVHYTLLRAASGRLPDTLGALVLEGSAVVGIALYYTVEHALGPRGTVVSTTRAGVLVAAASGLAISGASILLFYSLRRGGPVASTGAIVLGGGVGLSALVAPFAFGESFSVRRAVGVLLGVVAIVVLSQDGRGTE